jgi:uncharacterized membrane protein YeiB
MRALFSLLFGVGMFVLIDRFEKRCLSLAKLKSFRLVTT